MLRQINLNLPDKLLSVSKEYCEEYGYRNVQELILDLLRQKTLFNNDREAMQIEKEMDKGINTKEFSQDDAIDYLKGL